MSDFEHREGSGFLFKNEAKDGQELPENAPVLKGKCLVNGKLQEIALWRSEDGKKHSFSFKITDPFVGNAMPEETTKDVIDF